MFNLPKCPRQSFKSWHSDSESRCIDCFTATNHHHHQLMTWINSDSGLDVVSIKHWQIASHWILILLKNKEWLYRTFILSKRIVITPTCAVPPSRLAGRRYWASRAWTPLGSALTGRTALPWCRTSSETDSIWNKIFHLSETMKPREAETLHH